MTRDEASRKMRVRIILTVGLAISVIASPSFAVEECHGGNRAARNVTCVVDGDTIWQSGVKMRLLEIDAPETFGASCARERLVGNAAKARLIELMAGGYRVEDSGGKDRTSDRRELVRVTLKDGRDAGLVLMSEGLAQRWPNKGNRWCD